MLELVQLIFFAPTRQCTKFVLFILNSYLNSILNSITFEYHFIVPTLQAHFGANSCQTFFVARGNTLKWEKSRLRPTKLLRAIGTSTLKLVQAPSSLDKVITTFRTKFGLLAHCGKYCRILRHTWHSSLCY